MRTAIRLDDWILKRVERGAHLLQPLTGLSSYRLSQLLIPLWMCSMVVKLANYFAPAKGGPTPHLLDVLIFPLWAYWATVLWAHCTKAQADWQAGKTSAQPIPFPLAFTGLAWYRLIMTYLCLIICWIDLMLAVRHGLSRLSLLSDLWNPAWSLFVYLIHVHPKPYAPLRVLVPIAARSH